MVALDYPVSASLDDRIWRSLIGLDAVDTYRPTYAKLLDEYKQTNFKPTFMVEVNYELEFLGADYGSPQVLRRQEYWTMLSGRERPALWQLLYLVTCH